MQITEKTATTRADRTQTTITPHQSHWRVASRLNSQYIVIIMAIAMIHDKNELLRVRLLFLISR
ncbi:hypothetical protein [Chroococcidiopsis sp. SAG 2025]|uniref:hypothetical protein n=1 Tax=Chroococcidiopsis sp. SAG 2025 TaxID=171389 RepID=UPI0029370308|nr:hypothetical protein [Chroococcidiopsis sp. SAG 2025]